MEPGGRDDRAKATISCEAVSRTLKTASAYCRHSRGFSAELVAAGRRELVVLGAPVVLGESPLGFDEAFALEAMECLVECGVFDGEDVVGALADPS